MSKVPFLPAAFVLLLGACASGAGTPPVPPPRPAPGFFSAAQVERGRASYVEACGPCHARSEFRGPDFEWRWRRQTAWELYDEISTTMPENEPGGLSNRIYTDIVAYLLSLNGYQMGSEDLLANREVLAAIPLGAGVEKTKSRE